MAEPKTKIIDGKVFTLWRSGVYVYNGTNNPDFDISSSLSRSAGDQ